MDENSLLIPVAMKIIMNSGNARTKANEALEALSIFDFSNAHKKIVQKEAAGEHYKTCLLFTHAQDTLMTIMSEVNLTEKMIILFESFYQIQGHKEN